MIDVKTNEERQSKRYRQYTDEEKAFALVALDFNLGNLNRAARELSIPRKTLAEWAAGRNQNVAVAKKRQLQGEEIADKLEELVWRILASVTDEKLRKTKALDLIRMSGICIDKMLQLRGCRCGAAQGRRGLQKKHRG